MADTAYLGIEVDSSGLRKGGRDLDTFATKGKQTGDKVKKSTGLMTRGFNSVKNSIAATLLATAGLGVAIMTIANFESSVSKMGAVSRATTVELAAMRDIAQEFGSATEFSATQAADGLTFLAMAGFSASESMAALPAVLDLATASGMGLAAAADTASNIMSGFGVAAEHAADVADLLAAASSRANTDVAQLGDAMKFVGPVASALGIEMSDAAAAIGVLSDAGIQGGMAGTSLRQVLSGLVNPTGAAKTAIQGLGLTVDEISPQTNNLVDIIAKFADAGVTASDAMTILGDRGGPALLALTSQSDSLRELSGELGDVEGEAARMAETFRDNLGGDIQGAKSAAQGLILALGDAGLTAILRGLITFVTELTRHITNLVNGFSNFTSMIRNLFSFAAAEERVAAASEAVNVAIEEQVKQHDALNISLGEGKTVSIDYAGALLANARATLASTSATRELRIEEIKRTDAYIDLVEKQVDANRLVQDLQNLFNGNAVSQELQRMADTSLQVNGNLNGMLELYQSTLTKLQANTAEQNLLTGQVNDTSEATVILENQIRLIEAAIAGSLDGTVRFGAELEEADQTAEQLAISAAGVATQISIAAQFALNLANNLAAAPQGLEGLEQKARQMTAQISALDSGLGQVAASSAGYRVELEALYGLADAANASENAYISGVINREVAAFENVQNLNNAYSDRVTALNKVETAGSGAATATEKTADAMARQISALEDSADPMRVFNRGMAELDEMKLLGLSEGAYAKGVEDLTKEMNDGGKVAKSFADTLKENVEGAVTGVSDAFADLVMRGFKDFASFANSVVDTFKNMLIKMISMAAQNQIMISLGMSGGGVGGGTGSALMSGADAALSGGGSLVGVTGLMGGLGAGAGMAASGLMGGGLAGMTGAITAQVGAATAAGASMAAMGAAIGAVALPLAAVLAVVSFFNTKTKTIDSGIKGVISMEDAAFKSFKEIEKSRFFGLSKKRSTSVRELTGANSAPLDAAVFAIRESVIGATESLGVSSDVFNGFSHRFELSLKGLDDAARNSAISEEFTKMGDSLAGLVPHIDNMNQLFEVAANRVSLTDRLLQAQGKTEELTTRIREREMAVTSELNQVLLASVFAAEDAAAAQAAMANDSFTTLQEAMFAATSGGYRTTGDEALAAANADREILREIVVAVRTGNVNTARLLTEQLANAERDELNPEVVT
jgi:TP901 family phage tail tape measure protein